MDDVALELALDRTLARLEAALIEHTRAWAERGVAPPTPAALLDPAARRVLERGAHEPRVRPYLAACRLAAIEADAAVVHARAVAPSWSGLAALTAARAAAVAPGRLRAVLSEALGVDRDRALDLDPGDDRALAPPAAVPDAPAGFRDAVGLPPIEAPRLAAIATTLALRHGVDARALRIEVRDQARCFVIDPGRDVRITVRGGDAPARWIEALHELGHALLGLRAGPRPSRSHDEGVAAWIARALERPAFVAQVVGVAPEVAARVAAIARGGRDRQVAQRAQLAAFEAHLLDGAAPPPPAPGRALVRPPAPLWLDPGAQLVYAAADRIADDLDRRLGDAWPTARLPPEIAPAQA